MQITKIIQDHIPAGEDETYCPERFYCKAGELISLPRAALCDGVVVCDEGEDEAEEICPQRFPCSNVDGVRVSLLSISIAASLKWLRPHSLRLCYFQVFFHIYRFAQVSVANETVCDGVIDCVDALDELNCHSDGRFYCQDKSPLFVTKEKVDNWKW